MKAGPQNAPSAHPSHLTYLHRFQAGSVTTVIPDIPTALHQHFVPGEEHLVRERLRESAVRVDHHFSDALLCRRQPPVLRGETKLCTDRGLDTLIGEGGVKVSGGEKQRLSIARALLRHPQLLVFDEATSSLDTESEQLVQEAINNMMQHRTSIVIAHRLSTVRHADEIVVLQKGVIVERGNHDELIQHQGMYKRLVDMQEVK